MKEINITNITPSTKPTYKGMSYSGRKCFILDVTYILADGRSVPTAVSAERKKDVLPRLQREQQMAANGAMKATFNDLTGEFQGTVSRFEIGLRGLQPIDGNSLLPEPVAAQSC